MFPRGFSRQHVLPTARVRRTVPFRGCQAFQLRAVTPVMRSDLPLRQQIKTRTFSIEVWPNIWQLDERQKNNAFHTGCSLMTHMIEVGSNVACGFLSDDAFNMTASVNVLET